MAQNPPLGIPLVIRPPTRLVPSGTLTIAAGSTQFFSGSNQRQDRIEFIITNLDPANSVKVIKNSQNGLTIFPQSNISLLTSDDITLSNPGGAGVQIEVLEIYPDTGNLNQQAAPFAPGSAPGAGGGGLGGGGGTVSGGGSRAYSGGSRSAQTP